MDIVGVDAKAVSLARIACRAQIGLDAPLVHVEVNLGSGLPVFCIVGLPAMVVKESKERVRAALLNSHFEFPAGRITVNLAPADVPKEGGRFDLPIALGILIASQQIKPQAAVWANGAETEFYGELGLGGELRPTRGLLLAAAHASRHGHELILPRASAHEALVVARTTVRAADHLLEVCAHVEGKELLTPLSPLSPEAALGLSKDDSRGSHVIERPRAARQRRSPRFMRCARTAVCEACARHCRCWRTQSVDGWATWVGQEHARAKACGTPSAAYGAGGAGGRVDRVRKRQWVRRQRIWSTALSKSASLCFRARARRRRIPREARRDQSRASRRALSG